MMLMKFGDVGRFGLIFLLASLVASSVLGQQSRTTSLDIVPKGAAFYWASMNHKAQYDAVINSEAYQQLMKTTVAENMRRAYRNGLRRGFQQFGNGNPFAQYLQVYSETVGSMTGKMALNVLSDIFRNEVFVYADENWNAMSDAANTAYLRVLQEVMSPGDFENFGEENLARMLPILRQEFEGVNTPTIVIGTVVDDSSSIEDLVQLVEVGVNQWMNQMPPNMDYLAGAYDVTKEDGTYLLSLTLTDTMIPWDELKNDPFFEEHGDEVKALMTGKSIALTFGIKGSFLLLSIGPSNDHVTSFGKGPLLIDQPKCQPLKNARSQPLTGVTYVSREVTERSRDYSGLIDYMVVGLESAVRDASGDSADSEAMIRSIKSDARELKADLAAATPESGEYLSFSFLNPQGIGGYAYDWSENKYLDDSKPLNVLQHVGESPALVLAGRDNGNLAQYELASKWAAKCFGYAERYAPRYMNQPDADSFRDMMLDLRPILKTAENATRQEFLPAVLHGQIAVVLDFSSKTNAWHMEMPPADSSLPLPALAVVIEVHDTERVKRAGAAYLDVARDLLELLRSIPDAGIPDDIYIEPPQVRSVGTAQIFYYEIPTEAGLSDLIVPHVALSSDWLIFSYLPDQSANLLSRSSPRFSGPLADANRPLMAAAFYDNHQLIDALYDWCKYGMQLAEMNGESLASDFDAENDLLSFTDDDLKDALDAVVDLIKRFHGFESASWTDDGAQVTEFQLFFKDIPAKE